jgi:hypothetical protein
MGHFFNTRNPMKMNLPINLSQAQTLKFMPENRNHDNKRQRV